MSGAWWQSDWAVVVALLACEAALIGCVAWLAQRKMRSARRRLIVWQSALLAVFAVAVGELAGVGPSLVKALSQDTPEPWAPQAEVSTGVAIVTEEKPLIRELVEQRLRESQSANPPQLQLQFEEMESLAPVPTPPKASQSMTLGWVWLIGSASLLCLIAGRRVCFWFCSLRFKRVNCPQLRERLETVARRLGVKSRIDLRISHRLTTPAAYGLMRLTVGLPEDFESENSVERQEALLAHELAHLRAGDPWWHLGADLLTAALWWQPLVWWIAGSMKSASESAADEASLCVENGPEALAECLVEFGKRLTPRSAASAIGMAGSGYTSRLGQRVEALLDMAGGAEPIKPTFRQTLIRIGGAVLLASVGLTMVACCAPRSVGNAETPLAMAREAIAAQQPAAEIVVAAAPEPRERIDTAPAKKSSENRPEAARRVESDLTPGQTLEEARQLEQDAVLFEEGIRLADRGEVANAEAQKRAAIEGLTRARYAIAKGFFEQRKFPEAIAQMDLLLRFVPKSATGKQYKTYISQTADKHVGRMASEEMLDKVPAYLADKKDVAGLIQDGKFLYEMRKFDEAKKRFRKAIELDPNATAARYYLSLIQVVEDGGEARNLDTLNLRHMTMVERAWNNGLPLRSRTQLTPNPYFRTNTVSKRLNAFRVDKIPFEGATPLPQILSFLKTKAQQLDSPAKRINFIISPLFNDTPGQAEKKPGGGAPLLDAFGQPIRGAAPAKHASDLERISINIKPGLRDLPLSEVLDEIVKGADRIMHWTSKGDDVVFTPGEALFTRVFKVDPKRFMEYVKSMTDGAGPGNRSDPQIPAENSIATAVRKIFTDAGLRLESDDATARRPQIYFKDRTGILMVRGTLKELEIVEAVVKTLSAPPALVTIEVKFMEITLDADKTREGQSLPTILSAIAPELKLTRIDAPRSKRADSGNATVLVKKAPNDGSIQIDDYSSHHWAGRLNPAQFRSVIRTFEQTDGVEVLSLPRITTKSGRQANVEVIDLMSLPTGLQSAVPADKNSAGEDQESKFGTTEARVGVMLALLPYISLDRQSVRMTLIPSHTEFLGFDELREHIDRKSARELKKKKLTMAFPRLRVRTTVTDVVAKDGETIVIGLPMVTDEETERKGLFRRKRKISHAKHLVVFVTPTIVEPEGNPVNARK
jgi:beta-lactamase regulating signal transducer with metallopeptidase domain/tetratricopeptide (TPR) repeat protein